MFNLAIAKQFLSYSWVKLVVTIVVSISIIILSEIVAFKAENATSSFWFYFAITSVPSIMIAAHFVVPFVHLSSHHLWRVNPKYRRQTMSTILAMLVISCMLFAFYGALSASASAPIFWWLLIANLASALTIMQLYFSFHFVEKITAVFIVIGISVSAKKGVDFRAIASGFFAIEVLLLTKAYYESLSKGRKLSIMMLEVFDPDVSTIMSSGLGYGNWFLKLFGKSIDWKNQNLGWALNLPFTRIGLLPLLFLAIILLMSIGKETRNVSDLLIVVYSLSISLSIPIETSGLLKQLRPILHLFPNKNHAIKAILRKIEYLSIVQSTIFVALSLLTSWLLNWSFDIGLIAIVAIVLYLFNWAVYPFLMGKNIKKIKFNGLLFMIVYIATIWFVFYTLKVASTIESKLITGSAFIAIFLLLRVLSTRHIYSQSLEQLTAGGCLGASK